MHLYRAQAHNKSLGEMTTLFQNIRDDFLEENPSSILEIGDRIPMMGFVCDTSICSYVHPLLKVFMVSLYNVFMAFILCADNWDSKFLLKRISRLAAALNF